MDGWRGGWVGGWVGYLDLALVGGKVDNEDEGVVVLDLLHGGFCWGGGRGGGVGECVNELLSPSLCADKVEENEAVRMSCWEQRVLGWVGGWVGG